MHSKRMLLAAVLWALVMLALAPTNASADPCAQRRQRGNPHCTAPEVPIAALYPALGAVSFAIAQTLRHRRQPPQPPRPPGD